MTSFGGYGLRSDEAVKNALGGDLGMIGDTIFGFDIDGVCQDFSSSFMDYVNRGVGKQKPDIVHGDITMFDWSKCVDWLTPEVFKREMSAFACSGAYRNLQFFRYSTGILKTLIEHSKGVWFITARPYEVRNDTVLSFAGVFGLEEAERRIVVVDRGKKSEKINSLHIDVFVEDAPHHVGDITEQTQAQVILMDQPYNQMVSGPNIIRVNGWLSLISSLKDVVEPVAV